MTSCHGAAHLYFLYICPYHYFFPRLDKRGIDPFVVLNVCYHRQKWSATEFLSVCMVLLNALSSHVKKEVHPILRPQVVQFLDLLVIQKVFPEV